MRKLRRGLTLVEVIVAMLVFCTGALALAATSAFIARQISANNLRGRAAYTARNNAEKEIAAGCRGRPSSDGLQSPVPCN